MARPRSCQSRPAAHTRCLVPHLRVGAEAAVEHHHCIRASCPYRSSRLHDRQRAALVAPHQAGVTDNVGSEDRRQFALLTDQWNFPAFLERIVEGANRLGNQSEGACLDETTPRPSAPDGVGLRPALRVRPRSNAIRKCATLHEFTRPPATAKLERAEK